jgi:hypothetical protein
MLATLKEDVARLPELLAHAAGAAPEPAVSRPAWRPAAAAPAADSPAQAAKTGAEQLGLF